MSDIVLQDHDIVYPPQSSLPKPQGTIVLCRLSQYPAKDKETKQPIDGEFTNCCFTSAFGKQTKLGLPNGKELTLTVSSWRRTKDGSIASNPNKEKELTYWFNDEEDDKLLYCIENKIFFMFADRANPDDPPMLPDVYAKKLATQKANTKVQPMNMDDLKDQGEFPTP